MLSIFGITRTTATATGRNDTLTVTAFKLYPETQVHVPAFLKINMPYVKSVNPRCCIMIALSLFTGYRHGPSFNTDISFQRVTTVSHREEPVNTYM